MDDLTREHKELMIKLKLTITQLEPFYVKLY